jgi:uncharacterized protein GlcG (DUF336 family)
MYEKLVLDVSDAMDALDAMVKAAPQQSQSPMAMAVVDANGDLMGFMRMDGTPPHSMRFATGKAYTAARMRTDVSDFAELLKSRGGTVANLGDPRLISARGGGVVIAAPGDGGILGGIGVSGGTFEEDEAVARRGLAAIHFT